VDNSTVELIRKS